MWSGCYFHIDGPHALMTVAEKVNQKINAVTFQPTTCPYIVRTPRVNFLPKPRKIMNEEVKIVDYNLYLLVHYFFQYSPKFRHLFATNKQKRVICS